MKCWSIDSLMLIFPPYSQAKPISKCSFLQRGAVEDCVPGDLVLQICVVQQSLYTRNPAEKRAKKIQLEALDRTWFKNVHKFDLLIF